MSVTTPNLEGRAGGQLSNRLFSGFFWFFFISAALILVGFYWALTVLVPFLIGLVVLLISIRNRRITLRSLRIRPISELREEEPADSELLSISESGIRIVATDQYKENWSRIASELQVESADTFPIQGTLRAYALGPSQPDANSDLCILACVDHVVVGEVARIEVAKVAPNILALRGAGTCVLNTSLDANGRVKSIKAYPVPDDQPWWKVW